MSEFSKYLCNCCGQEHEGWPAITFKAPDYYHSLSEEEKKQTLKYTDDFCVVKDGEDVHRFIRCTMTQKVVDHCEDLEYGVWVSLSEKSYQDYYDNYDNENHTTQYFGWLSNDLPDYEFEEGIPTTVVTRSGNQRPEVIPHDDFDHPFVHDYYHGITKEEAERRIDNMLNRTSQQ